MWFGGLTIILSLSPYGRLVCDNRAVDIKGETSADKSVKLSKYIKDQCEDQQM